MYVTMYVPGSVCSCELGGQHRVHVDRAVVSRSVLGASHRYFWIYACILGR